MLHAVDRAWRDAVSPTLDRSDDGTGNGKDERGGTAGADDTRGQLNGGEKDWGVGPSGELSNVTEGLRSLPR